MKSLEKEYTDFVNESKWDVITKTQIFFFY